MGIKSNTKGYSSPVLFSNEDNYFWLETKF